MDKLNKMARQNLGIDFNISDQSKLKYDSPLKNEKRFADSLEREMYNTERKSATKKLLNNEMSGYLDLFKSPTKQENNGSGTQRPQENYQKPLIEKPKIASSKAINDIREPQELMNDTGYNIAKAKFFGVEPDEKLSLKNDAKVFYGGEKRESPTRLENKQKERSDLARSVVSNAGNMILRSQSVNNLSSHMKQGSPVSNQSAYQRLNASPTQYSHKVPYYYSHYSMPKLPNVAESGRKDDFDTKSTATYVSDILKRKKKVFGINENTLNMMTFDPQADTTSGNKRSLTLATSTDLNNKGIGTSTFVGRESDKYKDNTKEKIVDLVNNNRYHKKNDLSNYTYNAMTGRYY